MIERRAKAGAPDHRIEASLTAVRPFDGSFVQAHKRRLRYQHATFPRVEHRGHHDDIAEAAGQVIDAAALLLSLPARGCTLEQHATIDLIGKECRRVLSDPYGFADLREFRQDLRGGIAAADHHHALAGEGRRVPVVR